MAHATTLKTIFSQRQRKMLGVGGEASYSRLPRKARLTRVRFVMQIKVGAFSIDKSFMWFKVLLQREEQRGKHWHLLAEISLINVNVPYKRVTSTLFLEIFLCLLFLKIVSSKYSLHHRSIFWVACSATLHSNG